jgi:uncharacterized membrane protein
MTIKAIKTDARDALRGRWGQGILLTIVTFGIYILVPLLIEIVFSGGPATWREPDTSPGYAQVISWIVSLALSPLIFGYYWTFLSLNRSETVRVKDLFNVFNSKLYFKSLGIYVLATIYTFLWTLLLIVPGIIKSFAYSQVYFILKDNPTISANEAITQSRKLMFGYKWKYFLLQLSFIGWGILSTITLGIGFIWLVPYITASLAAFYDQLVKKQNNSDGEITV